MVLILLNFTDYRLPEGITHQTLRCLPKRMFYSICVPQEIEIRCANQFYSCFTQVVYTNGSRPATHLHVRAHLF